MIALQPKRASTKLATVLTGRLSFLGIGRFTLVETCTRVKVLKAIVLSVWCVVFVNATELSNGAAQVHVYVDGESVHSLKKGYVAEAQCIGHASPSQRTRDS